MIIIINNNNSNRCGGKVSRVSGVRAGALALRYTLANRRGRADEKRKCGGAHAPGCAVNYFPFFRYRVVLSLYSCSPSCIPPHSRRHSQTTPHDSFAAARRTTIITKLARNNHLHPFSRSGPLVVFLLSFVFFIVLSSSFFFVSCRAQRE